MISPGKLVLTIEVVITLQLFWRMMDHLLKGFKDGRWRGQTGINFSIYAALVCTNLPWMMLMIPCVCSLPSWRTLHRKLFLRLRQYQNISINHDFQIRFTEISDTIRKHLGEMVSPRWILKHWLNLYGIGSTKLKERKGIQ